MKKIVVSILVVVMLLSVISLAGCNRRDIEDDDISANATTTLVGVTLPKPQGASMYEFSRYGYHIYYPQGFRLLNDEGNMVEFMNDLGVDFTVLVLDNKYESLALMMDSQLEDGDEVVKQGSTYFLVYSASNGRTTYTYYYFGEDMVRCELSYLDAHKDDMKGLEEKIMVERHIHSH